MNFETQAEQYMIEIASVARPKTLQVYRSILNTRILPAIGKLELSEVDNKTVKLLVGRLAEADLSPATISLAVTLVKQIVKSAVDERGNPLYPVVWNPGFIKAPEVLPEAQNAPIMGQKPLGEALQRTSGRVKVLVALLAGTGLRIGEALALGVEDGNVWDPQSGTLSIRATVENGQLQPQPKTRAGRRVVDLAPQLNDLMKAAEFQEDAPLFPKSYHSYFREFQKLGIPGFHSLRRLRVTHLQNENVPISLIKFWIGHSAGDISERYTKFGAEIRMRKDWSIKAGLGFSLE
jgi:integrase